MRCCGFCVYPGVQSPYSDLRSIAVLSTFPAAAQLVAWGARCGSPARLGGWVASSTRAHRPDCAVAVAKRGYLAGGASYFGNCMSNEADTPLDGDLIRILRSQLAPLRGDGACSGTLALQQIGSSDPSGVPRKDGQRG